MANLGLSGLASGVDDPSSCEDAERGLLGLGAYGELVHVPDPGPVAEPAQPGTPLTAAIPPLTLRT